jgi:virginiamycin B lyase
MRTWLAFALLGIAACGGGKGPEVAAGTGGSAGITGAGGNPAVGGSGGTGTARRSCSDGVCITEFAVGGSLTKLAGIAAGPDGDVWFTGQFGLVGHIRTDGSHPSLVYPFGGQADAFHDFGFIAAGPDGYLWFGEQVTVPATGVMTHELVRMSTSGAATELGTEASFGAIVVGPDDNLWVAQGQSLIPGTVSGIVRMTRTEQTTLFPTPDANANIEGLTVGPDGNLWFTIAAGALGRLTPAGAMTMFPLPQHPEGLPAPGGICAGPDGSLWFVEWIGNRIGRMTVDGAVTELDVPGSKFLGHSIVAGPDGNLWFMQQDSNTLNRITPGGVITKFPIPSDNVASSILTRGPDGNIWFSESNLLNVARVTFEP